MTLLRPGNHWVMNRSLPNGPISLPMTLVRTPWLSAYAIISGVNIILRDIDNIASQDPKAARRIKGQALAIRAHVHFDLLRLYGESLEGNSTAKGIPYVTTFDVTDKPGRSNVKESYDKILADLSEAATPFSPANWTNPLIPLTNKSRIDWLVVKAMQARVYLYAGLMAGLLLMQLLPLLAANH